MATTNNSLTSSNDDTELTFNHRPIEYSFCKVNLSNPRLFVSDPWGILRGHLSSEIEQSSNGAKARYKMSLNYALQAEQFGKAARVVELPTKATLAYYSMSNLAKSYLLYIGKDSGSHHGLTYNRNSDSVEIMNLKGNKSTFRNLSIALNSFSVAPKTLSLSDLTSRIIEIHKLHTLWNSPKEKLKFLPIDIRFLEIGSNFTVKINIQEKDRANYDIQNFLQNGREDHFKKISDLEFRLHRARKNIKEKLETKVNDLLKKELRKCNFIDLLDTEDYVHYCYLGDTTFHHLCYPYLLMFYIGYLARYNPKRSEELMNGQEYALINEVVNLCFPQFTYQILSRFLERKCVVPKGANIIV